MADSDFYRVFAEISAAKNYTDLFGTALAVDTAALAEVKKAYRTRVVHIHPDRVDAWNKDLAADAFNRLTDLYNQAVGVANGGSAPTAAPVVIATSTGAHTLGTAHSAWSDMAACYEATSEVSGRSLRSFVKIARTPIDNDMIGAEAEALNTVLAGCDNAHIHYYPEVLDTFGTEVDGKRVRANAFTYLEGFYNLEQVRQARPSGVEPLDAAWMWRRLLWALGYAHDKGVIHGAVLPQNVMILPEQHGLVLVDWAYSLVKRGSVYLPLKAVVGRQRDWYPTTVFAKKNATPTLDIIMAARTFMYLMGGNPVTRTLPSTVPPAMRSYFMKLADVGAPTVLETALEYEDMLVQLGAPYYPRRFRPFVL